MYCICACTPCTGASEYAHWHPHHSGSLWSNQLHQRSIWFGILCRIASIVLIVTFTIICLGIVDPSFMKPFTMYLLGMLIMSGSWHYSSCSIYIVRQAVMLGSLLVARLLGKVWASASMANTASTFLVLWLMGLYFTSHYLHTHAEHILSLFDPIGLYN